ncbi:MAG: CRISPR system precrRNA processing endoribonuclease RAMP protein Cas6 [Candidatus Methanomethylicaceae archaeon]
MNYIVSLTYHIVSHHSFKMKRYSGLSIRSLFYDFILKKIFDSNKIHEFKGLKPFSVTPLYRSENDSYYIYQSGDKFIDGYFRIVFLSVKNIHEVIDKLSRDVDIEIDEEVCKIDNIEYSIVSYNDLIRELKIMDNFIIEFLSPTILRSPSYYIKLVKENNEFKPIVKTKWRKRGIYLPLPYPQLIFKSIIRCFKKFSEIENYPYDEINEFVNNDGIMLSGYPNGIKTMAIKVSKKEAYIGFVGKVQFTINKTILNMYENVIKYIPQLLKYAEYSNIGGNRLSGFGWVKVKM